MAGIQLASNFNLSSPLPLDSRFQVADLTERDAIPLGERYEGLMVYVVSEGKYYALRQGIENAQWEDINQNAQQFKSDYQSPELGVELLDDTDWTTTGWTGDFATGFTNTNGNVLPLTKTVNGLVNGKLYQFTITTTNAHTGGWSDFFVSLGGTSTFETYKGGGNLVTYVFGLLAGSGAALEITPRNSYVGKISGLSLREITSTIPPTLTLKDFTDINAAEIRPTTSTKQNVFMGNSAGELNHYGTQNVGIGARALSQNTDGFWNTAVGMDALKENINGSRNVAVGRIALLHNRTGDRNIAIGTFTLEKNINGRNNVAIGADSMQDNLAGNYNVAIGTSSLVGNVNASNNIAVGYRTLAINSGNDNIAMGKYTMTSNTSGEKNIAIGESALYKNATGSDNIAMGRSALYNAQTASFAIALGYRAATKAVTGLNIIAIGQGSQENATGGDNNISLGYRSLRNIQGANGNIAIGNSTLINNATGNENVAIGHLAGKSATGAAITRNVFLGYNAGSAVQGTSNYNVVLGASAGTSLTSGNQNILIGWNVQTPEPAQSNYLNIGDVIKGTMGVNPVIGIGVNSPAAVLHLKEGRTAAGSAPLKFTQGVLMTIAENGAFEFDGTNLYFTVGGVRKVVQLV